MSYSLLFALLFGMLIGWLIQRWSNGDKISALNLEKAQSDRNNEISSLTERPQNTGDLETKLTKRKKASGILCATAACSKSYAIGKYNKISG